LRSGLVQEQRCDERQVVSRLAKSCERVDYTSKPNPSTQGPENRFTSRRGQVSLFLTDFGGISALEVFFHEIRTFCKPLLLRRRKESCCQAVDKKKERFSVFSDFG